MQGELTDGEVHIYSDDISVARWRQRTIETLLHPPFADEGAAVQPAVFTVPTHYVRTVGSSEVVRRGRRPTHRRALDPSIGAS